MAWAMRLPMVQGQARWGIFGTYRSKGGITAVTVALVRFKGYDRHVSTDRNFASKGCRFRWRKPLLASERDKRETVKGQADISDLQKAPLRKHRGFLLSLTRIFV